MTKACTERAFDITFESLTNIFAPSVGVQRIFWSKNFKVGLPFSNAPHYVNPEVDKLLEAAAVEVDEGRRRELFVQFQKQVHSAELGRSRPALWSTESDTSIKRRPSMQSVRLMRVLLRYLASSG